MAAETARASAKQKREYFTKYENLISRAIADGRRVDEESLGREVIQPFKELSWFPFLDSTGPVYDELVRQFYASYEYDIDNDKITFCLHNTVYSMTLDTFGIYLCVPTTGHRFYSVGQNLRNLPAFLDPREVINLLCKNPSSVSNNIRSGDLKPPHDLRYKIVDWNIYCRDGNHNEVPASEAALLWCLHHKIEVNIAYFIAKRMVGLTTNRTRALPYSMLLNTIFHSLQIPLPTAREIDQQPLSNITLTRMGKTPSRSKSKRARMEEVSSEEEDRAYDQAGPSGSGTQAIESPERELSPEDHTDEFYSMSPTQQTSVLYRQQRAIRKEQRGIKRLLKDILNAITCSRNMPPSPHR